MITTDTHTRYENALRAAAQAQAALDATKARRPVTGDGVQDTQPYLLWAADMTNRGDKLADAVIELANAKEAAALATPDQADAIRNRANTVRTQFHNTFGSSLTTIRAAALDLDNEDSRAH
ncbi:hypothetical protein [Kitasatospora aureofaciens]|uniref:hypothetical protein n=1 Tax=Kitasatospora aureofaciens TaxID=1894 RepID=UPI0005265DF5|nr:hypothetical protein [Kitasatospora aureofaciens]